MKQDDNDERTIKCDIIQSRCLSMKAVNFNRSGSTDGLLGQCGKGKGFVDISYHRFGIFSNFIGKVNVEVRYLKSTAIPLPSFESLTSLTMQSKSCCAFQWNF